MEDLQNFRPPKIAHPSSIIATHFTTLKPQKHHPLRPTIPKTPLKSPAKTAKPRFPGVSSILKKILQLSEVNTGIAEDSNSPEAAAKDNAAAASAAGDPERANPRPACSTQPATPSSTPWAA